MIDNIVGGNANDVISIFISRHCIPFHKIAEIGSEKISLFPDKRVKNDHNDAVILLHKRQNIVWDVAMGISKSASRRVGEHDWRGGCCEDVFHRVVAHVGDVDDHSKSVHFLYNFLTKFCKSEFRFIVIRAGNNPGKTAAFRFGFLCDERLCVF